VSSSERLPEWTTLNVAVPDVTVTMRRYLDQLACVLRPRSVGNADQALRSLAGFLAQHAPEVTSVAGVNHRHIEDFIRWLAARSGRTTTRITPATLAHRLGTRRPTRPSPPRRPVRPTLHPPRRSRIMIYLTAITCIMPR
jgi:hypothetical protein